MAVPNLNKAKKLKPKDFFRGLGLYILIILIGMFFFYGVYQPSKEGEQKPLSEVLTDIRDSKVKQVVVSGDKVDVTLNDGRTVTTFKEKGESFVKTLEASGINPQNVPLTIKDGSTGETVLALLNLFLPIIVIVFIFYFLFRQARAAGDTLFSFSKSRAKQFSKDKPQIRFTDVAGADEAKQELEEVVDFLKNPGKYKSLGAKIPKGVLLVGPAGVGKTLLARAVAGEADVPFFSIAGSEFMEMLVGVGASRVRDLFETAKKSAPSIIFIDEIDSIGRQRGLGLGGGHDEREQTLNQILVEMDGFEPNTGVIVMGATNRPDMLDPALVRPGRFDRRVVLDLPDINGRKEIIKIHARNKPLAEKVDLEKIAQRTVGFSGADLENMLNEAAILAARENKKIIEMKDLEEAAIKVQLGPQRKRMISEEEKKITAFHEGGHAVVTRMLPHMDPVHRISIISRGLSGGHTLIPPTQDRYNETKTRLLETITSMLGGRAAEKTEFNELTVGASNDIEKATEVARAMVTQFGMSSLGPISLGQTGVSPWLARELGNPKPLSEQLAAKVDKEVSKIIDSCFTDALKILKENRKVLTAVAEALMKKETLEGSEFEEIVLKVLKKAPPKQVEEKQPLDLAS